MSETTQETQHAPVIVDVDYEQSPTLVEFTKALAAAQAEIENAEKGAENPHFKTVYADLADVINAVRLPLAKNGLARLQTPRTKPNGLVGLRTALLHVSGEYIAFTVWCIQQQVGPQALGSVLTYLRRYSLAAAAGVGAEADDDGNAGQGRGEPPRDWNRNPPKGQPPAPTAAVTKSGGGPDKPTAAAAGSIDQEHADTLKKIRDCIGNELKWENKTARAFFSEVFGVDSTAKFSKEQAVVCLDLLIANVNGGEEGYQSVKAQALKANPSLFAKGAA